MIQAIFRYWRFLFLTLLTLAAGAVILWKVFWPAYQMPINRMYTSKLGAANMKRRLKIPFEVRTDTAQFRVLNRTVLGEGLITSDSVLIPIIPLDTIEKVYVEEGQKVEAGQLLAKLEDREILWKLESARLAVEIATAELKRTRLGTTYVAAQERPEEEKIRLNAAQAELRNLQEQETLYLKAVASGTLPPIELYDLQNRITQKKKEVDEYRFKLSTSTKGREQNLIKAEAVLKDAQINFESLKARYEKYAIYAPSDGIIAQVLIHEGEFNQDTGKPAFVLASGMWFDAHVDQAAIEQIKTGDSTYLYLEALQGQPISGKVSRIVPVVTFGTGGPEATRPLTPKGSGTPEWPATFKVRIEIDPEFRNGLYLGLTGFARISSARRVLSIPLKAVLSISAGHGVVHVIKADETREVKAVTLGVEENGYIEIASGLNPDESVIVEGHHVLEEDDPVVVLQEP